MDSAASSLPPSHTTSSSATPPSHVSTRALSSSSSSHHDACNECTLSPQSDQSNSPVAKALEHMHVPLHYPDSEDEDYPTGPPSREDTACMPNSSGASTATMDSVMHLSLSARTARHPMQVHPSFLCLIPRMLLPSSSQSQRNRSCLLSRSRPLPKSSLQYVFLCITVYLVHHGPVRRAGSE